ncbi:hypothetical protein AB0C29_26585 [Actinoplanes sp. NPDC048791]|uniref:hypothetical protein n=1 Tax=Actinoplanes sp. NPDC048791 TaxID=3154623 RepID=UPI003403FB46
MRKIWYAVALLLLGAGLFGLSHASPSTPRPEPEALEVRFPGASAAPGTVVVRRAGAHAIWASGDPAPDANRCQVTAPSGQAVPVSAASRRVVWVVRAEDDAAYTWIATFEAAQAGSYGLRCTPDPEAPGAAYQVTERPAVGPAIGLGVASGVAVLAAVMLALTTFARRRRRVAAGK